MAHEFESYAEYDQDAHEVRTALKIHISVLCSILCDDRSDCCDALDSLEDELRYVVADVVGREYKDTIHIDIEGDD